MDLLWWHNMAVRMVVIHYHHQRWYLGLLWCTADFFVPFVLFVPTKFFKGNFRPIVPAEYIWNIIFLVNNFALGAILGQNFCLRRYFCSKFLPAALILVKIFAFGANFGQNFCLRRYFWTTFCLRRSKFLVPTLILVTTFAFVPTYIHPKSRVCYGDKIWWFVGRWFIIIKVDTWACCGDKIWWFVGR